MQTWVLFTLFAVILWGLWGFFGKLANLYMKPQFSYVYEAIGAMIAGIVIAILVGFRLEGDWRGAVFGLLSGLSVGVGVFFFFIALARGPGAVVVTATALYPLVTLLLSFLLLHEALTLKQWAGIGLAVVSIVLLSSS